MAKEYIDRETAIDFVKSNTPTIDGETTMRCVERSLENVPTADVVEVRHGAWVKVTAYHIHYRCSECNHMKQYKKPYCEICGAKMDGKED